MSETKNLFENFQKHLNEGSEFIRVFPEDSMEYKRLKDFCTTLNKNSKRTAYSVEETYFDYGQNWKWTTIIAHTKKERGGGYQALTPADQEKVITNTNIDEVLKRVLDYDNKLGESSLEDVRKDSKEKGLLTEDYNPLSTELYMNTWGNYNINGADVESINGGWMDLERAKEFLEAHKEEEPFINDTENCPISVDEYDNPWEVIEHLEKIEELDNIDAFLAILEEHNDNFDEALDIYESGDYIFFAGVDNDEDLGRAYVDMVGIDGVSNIENYLDREQIKQEIIEYLEDSGEDVDNMSDETIDAMVDEDIETAAGNSDYIERYFDYEALGRDLDFEGYYFANTGAIYTM